VDRGEEGGQVSFSGTIGGKEVAGSSLAATKERVKQESKKTRHGTRTPWIPLQGVIVKHKGNRTKEGKFQPEGKESKEHEKKGLGGRNGEMGTGSGSGKRECTS